MASRLSHGPAAPRPAGQMRSFFQVPQSSGVGLPISEMVQGVHRPDRHPAGKGSFESKDAFDLGRHANVRGVFVEEGNIEERGDLENHGVPALEVFKDWCNGDKDSGKDWSSGGKDSGKDWSSGDKDSGIGDKDFGKDSSSGDNHSGIGDKYFGKDWSGGDKDYGKDSDNKWSSGSKDEDEPPKKLLKALVAARSRPKSKALIAAKKKEIEDLQIEVEMV